MPKYEVTFYYTAKNTVEIEADSVEDADLEAYCSIDADEINGFETKIKLIEEM